MNLMGRTHWPWREQACKTSAGSVSGETRASWTPGIDIRVRDLQRLSGLICLPSVDSTGSGHTILMFTVEPVFPPAEGLRHLDLASQHSAASFSTLIGL